jgi:hypothetical protein
VASAAPTLTARPARRPEHPVLRLQRTIGNRATRRLLARDDAAHPTAMKARRGEFPQLTKAYTGLDEKAWREAVAAAKQALDARDVDKAKELYTRLYQDLAATAAADKLHDVKAGLPINLANADGTGYAPGLNLVLGSGGAKPGSTGFVDANGSFNVKLNPKGTRPGIAIRLYSDAIKADKASSLGTLRHEMLHAYHHELALAALDGRKLKGVDKILADEAAGGAGRANTELLAYVEGFMTVFHLLDPAPDPRHPVFVELLGALDTGSLYTWASANKTVRNEALGRLREYYCDTLDAKHRDAFDAWVATQAEKVKTAKRDPQAMFEHFVRGLQQIVGAC